MEEEEGKAQQVSRKKNRAHKQLLKGKDLQELRVEVLDLILLEASRATQAKVRAKAYEEEAAKDPKSLEAKMDAEEDLPPSPRLDTKASASQALEDLSPLTATVLPVDPLHLDPMTLDPALTQLAKNMEPRADLGQQGVPIGCRVTTGGHATSIPRPCFLSQASPTS